ncbi:MAG: nucleotidyltransferase domain-containing protein [Verrucomicrobia bacterium]|nr:nucleotidyltransferase domain-containing protein [Verrucomicrobiota bacterium]
MTLLQERDRVRYERRIALFGEVRQRLREALAEFIPGAKVIIFGSLTKPGVFNCRSDVDLALQEEPSQMNSWQLASRLWERLERPVDVVLLTKCRFREKILREGELWTA